MLGMAPLALRLAPLTKDYQILFAVLGLSWGTAARAGHSLALASSGHRDGSLIRMKRIFLINRILLKL
jgi:hypothetical protein